MITGKVNITSDFFSKKVFKSELMPIKEEAKKPRTGVDHKTIMRASLSKDSKLVKSLKSTGINKLHVERAEKYKDKIGKVNREMDDSDSDE